MTTKTEIEYQLKILPYTDKRSGKEGHLFELATVKEFRNFRYDIIVDTEVKENTINLTIEGISTPELSIPQYGPARYQKVLYGLHGTYTVTIQKKTGAKNKYKIHFTPKKTIQKSKTNNAFIELETTHRE